MMPSVSALEAAIGLFAGLAGLTLIIYVLLRADMRQMRGEMLALRTDLTAEIKASEERLNASIKANAERIDAVERKVDNLGERVSALGERVALIDGKLKFLYRLITRQNEPPPAAAE